MADTVSHACFKAMMCDDDITLTLFGFQHFSHHFPDVLIEGHAVYFDTFCVQFARNINGTVHSEHAQA